MSYIVPRDKPKECYKCPFMDRITYDCKLMYSNDYPDFESQYKDCPLVEIMDKPRDSNGRFSSGLNDDWTYIEPLDGEEWKPIRGYEGRYMVSNMGRVRSRTKVLKASTGNIYAQVILNNGDVRHRKTVTVHRLVAEAFVENPYPNEYKYVNHKDENKRNNRADNLEWCTASYNLKYGTCREKMTEKRKMLFSDRQNNWFSKPVICVETNEIFCSIADAADKYCIDKSSISKVCNGIRKTAGGKHWKYVSTVIEAEGKSI